MRFASAISDSTNATQAADDLINAVDQRITRGMVDLFLLSVTPHFEDELPAVLDQLNAAFASALAMGCTAEGTIGADRELERVPSMSLLVASMPDVTIRPFHLNQDKLEPSTSLFDWERLVGVSPESNPLFIALADPFRFDVESFVNRINEHYPGAPLVGGLASAGHAPGQNRLILGDEIVREGIVGATMTGRFKASTVVSQGCRPIGKPFVITKGQRNVIQELGGLPVLKQLHDVLLALRDEDEKLARESLLIGRAIDEYRDEFTRGSFLIQNIIGVDRESGAVAIAGHAKIGATVQFHVRDAASADEDLRNLLNPHVDTGVEGAMMFGCNGRGTHMWPRPGHDIGVVHELLGDVPVAGFFCGGEFGPVGGKNFIHGFTASIALFSEPS